MKNFFLFIGCFFCLLSVNAQWTMLNSGVPNKLNDLFFTDTKTGYIVGNQLSAADEGLLLKTSNAGNSWKKIHLGIRSDFDAICFTNANTGFISTSNGLLIRTKNKGKTWDTVYQSANGIGKIFFAGEDTGYVIASVDFGQQTLIKTIDGGNTWFALPADHEIIYDMFFLDPDFGLLASFDDPFNVHVFETTDGGNSWKIILTGGYDIFSCVEAMTKKKYYVGDTEIAGGYYTHNGGKIWKTYVKDYFPVPDASDIFFTSDSVGWTIGDNEIARTENSARNWKHEKSPTKQYLNRIFFPSADTGYIVGDSGTVLRNVNGISEAAKARSAFSDSLDGIASKTILENSGKPGIMVYSNPGSGQLVVQTMNDNLPDEMKVIMIDLLGRPVEEFSISNNQVYFLNTSADAPGICFIKIISSKGELLFIKKILIE